jgi:hypothetical protein
LRYWPDFGSWQLAEKANLRFGDGQAIRLAYLIDQAQKICTLVGGLCFAVGGWPDVLSWLGTFDKYESAALHNRLGDFVFLFALCSMGLGVSSAWLFRGREVRKVGFGVLSTALWLLMPSWGVA